MFPSCVTDEYCEIPSCIASICAFDPLIPPDADLTGTQINSTQPIAVFGGHEKARVGEGCCAEHLEQRLLPVSNWGTHYLAARAEPRGRSREHWRIIAEREETIVETTLEAPALQRFTLNRGEFREIITEQSFEVSASSPVLVAQYLVSQDGTTMELVDPALIITPPTSQLWRSYQLITPGGYNQN